MNEKEDVRGRDVQRSSGACGTVFIDQHDRRVLCTTYLSRTKWRRRMWNLGFSVKMYLNDLRRQPHCVQYESGLRILKYVIILTRYHEKHKALI